MWPAASAEAAIIDRPLDDSLAEFTRGSFQRTGLTSTQVGTKDQKGAVQLVPVSVIKNWSRASFRLERKLTDLSAATIGNTIFVLGGKVVDDPSLEGPTNEVWSVQIDTNTGVPAINQWFNETQDLPAVTHTDRSGLLPIYTQPYAARSAMAVTSVETGPNSGYIYAIGGSFSAGAAAQELSSFAVTIAKVENGHITSWRTSDEASLTNLRIPGDPRLSGMQFGLQSASAVSHKIGNDTYVYLIGGLIRYLSGSNSVTEMGSNQVFYAKVRPSDGMLVHPTTGAVGWATTNPLPIPTSSQNSDFDDSITGLWDAAAVVGRFTENTTVRDIIFVSGGQYQSSVGNGSAPQLYSPTTYRGMIASNGSVTWPTDWLGTLPSARIGMGGVEVNGKLYLTGGSVGRENDPPPPEAAVLTSLVTSDFKLFELGSNGSNFIYQPTALQTPISPRSRHAMVKVTVPKENGGSDALAYVYVIGGRGAAPDNESINGSNTLIYAKVGGDEDVQTVGFAPNGWYYSSIFKTNETFSGEEVKEIIWNTSFSEPANHDIEISYRSSLDNDCNAPALLNAASWTEIKAVNAPSGKSSVNGENKFVFNPSPQAHCFQYRVRLVSSALADQLPTTTPMLLNVMIKVFVPGGPDIKVHTLNPTQDAGIDGTKQFYVDLLVFGPGETPVAPTPPWTTNPPGVKACVIVNTSNLPAGARMPIFQWYATDGAVPCASTVKTTAQLFPGPGEYTVYVVVDSYDCSSSDAIKGCVDESSPGAEDNNVSAPLKIVIAQDEAVGLPDTMLPIVLGKP